MMPESGSSNRYLKVYHGYGHTHNLLLYGHVFRNSIAVSATAPNMIRLLRLFTLKPVAGVPVRLHWKDQVLDTQTEQDGFFKFEWSSDTRLDYGWHTATVELPELPDNHPHRSAAAKVYVPHSTQYAFISDIDDTVLVSHSAKLIKRLRELLFRSPETRRIFHDAATHYRLLAEAHTGEETSNPFFYVSSSEWNLYDYLDQVFRRNGFPEGVFLLSQVKYWTDFLRSGQTGHNGKLLRIIRIMEAFPKQQFVLLGDNSQKDPGIYAAVVQKYPGKIAAIYIRNVRQERRTEARQLLQAAALSGVAVCIYNDSREAMEHSRELGLIS